MPQASFTEPEAALLERIQEGFPLVSQPWREMGSMLGLGEEETIRMARRLAEKGIIRSISGLFEREALGYRGTLAAFQCPPGEIERAAGIVNAHPGVSHNYERKNRYNLWFTLAVPPEGSIEDTLSRLARMAGAEDSLNLPVIRRYKLRVHLPLQSGESRPMEHDSPPMNREPLSPEDVLVVRALQEEFPFEPDVYFRLAVPFGLSEEELLERGRAMTRQGYLRRIAGVLRHREAGFRENALLVWETRPGGAEELGLAFAGLRFVSHCYERPISAKWPYPLYTMIHARTREELDTRVREMREMAGAVPGEILYTGREFKKSRVKYFSPEFEKWEKEHL